MKQIKQLTVAVELIDNKATLFASINGTWNTEEVEQVLNAAFDKFVNMDGIKPPAIIKPKPTFKA